MMFRTKHRFIVFTDCFQFIVITDWRYMAVLLRPVNESEWRGEAVSIFYRHRRLPVYASIALCLFELEIHGRIV